MSLNKKKVMAAADKYIAKQNYNKALNELLKIAKVSPNDANLLNKIGDLYSKVGNKSSAVNYFLKVAESYKNSGFNLKAIALYKKIIRIDPAYMDARDRLVDLYLQQGHHSEAKGELRRMAQHYYQENLFSRALTCYEKMVDIDPNNLEARIKITELLVREGRRDEAVEHFVAMGRELLNKNMAHEARKIIGQGLKMDPQNTKLLVLMARTYIAEGKTDDALNQLTELCRRNEDDLDAVKILGETYENRGQLEDARACYIRALHIDANETAPLEEVARQFIEKNRLDEAFKAVEPIAQAFVERGEYEEAVRVFRSILYVDENHIASQEILVSVYQAAGQTANAILSLEKMINHYMSSGLRTEAMKTIERLLEIDANNLEWKSKLENLRHQSATADYENTEIHVIDEDTPDDDSFDMGNMPDVIDMDPPKANMTLEPDDPKAVIANHLTEAEVFMKYGILDQALSHLVAVKDIDILNREANLKLKQLYLEKNEVDNAVGCMICLINAHIDTKTFHEASEIVKEIAEYRPDIARIHQGRLDSLIQEEDAAARGDAPNDPFKSSSSGVLLGQVGNAEVMDFSKIPMDNHNAVDMANAEEAIEEGWSLDMPLHNMDATADNVAAEDLRDVYNFQEEPPPKPAAEIHAFDFPAPTPAAPQPQSEPAEMEFIDDDTSEVTDITDLSGASLDSPAPAFQAQMQPPPQPEVEVHVEEDVEEDIEEIEDIEDLEEIEDLSDMEEADEPAPAAPAAKSHAPLESSHGSLAGELEEIDFFISVEAFEDARNLIAEARNHFGDHPLILERLQEVEAKTQGFTPAPIAFDNAAPETAQADDEEGDGLLDSDTGTGFFDLAAELSEELFEEEGVAGEVNDATSQEEIQSVEELFQEFKKGVDEQIDDSDHETHYDLGIAYKEMGLLDEAISEFKKAQRDEARFLECATMIGNCLVELGRTEDSIQHYETCLTRQGLAEEAQLALRYELAQAYQNQGELETALQTFREIQEVDPNYRDLDSMIAALV